MTDTDLTALPANDLARACAAASAQTGQLDLWREFVRRFQRPIALAILRTARTWGSPTPAIVDDLVQETLLRLCANNCRLLRAFSPREPDSILGFVTVIAANVTHDHFRAQTAERRGGPFAQFHTDLESLEYTPPVADHTNPQPDPLQSLQIEEIDRTLRSFVPATLTDRDCAIFWLYYQQGFAAREIAAIPTFGLSTKGVESSLHRSIRQLREALNPPQKGISTGSTINEVNG